MPATRALCASLAFLAPFAASVLAQSPGEAPRDQAPTFRAGTTLIEFTIVATDPDGRPVTDLRADEIAISDAGQPRDVAFFHYEGAPASAMRVTSLPPGIFTNRPEYAPGPPRNIVAIVIDALNTHPEDQVRVLAHILSFVSAIPGDTRVAIYRTGEQVQVIHDFTDDLQTLRERLLKRGLQATRDTQATIEAEEPIIEQWQADAMSATMEASMQEAYEQLARIDEKANHQLRSKRNDYTLAALEAVGHHLAGIPGRKSLVWMTSGMPMLIAGTRDPWPESHAQAMRAVGQRLASQGVSMYPVEAGGVRAPYLNLTANAKGSTRGVDDTVAAAIAGDSITRGAVRVDRGGRNAPTPQRRPAAAPAELQRSLSAMDLFADITGGRMLRNTNDLLAGVKAATSDLRGTYSVGFYVPQERDNRWHSLTVKLKRANVKLVHRQGYLSEAADRQSELWLADQWKAAAGNPLGSASVRLDARFELQGETLNAVLQIPAEDLEFRRIGDAPTTQIEFALAERTAQGLLRIVHEQGSFSLGESQAADPSQVTVRFRKQWTIDPRTLLMRIVIRDRNSGRFGTLDVPVSAIR